MKSLTNQVFNQVWAQVSNQIYNQINSQVRNQVREFGAVGVSNLFRNSAVVQLQFDLNKI